MAKKQNKINNPNLKNTSKIDTDVFAKGMVKDPDAVFTGKDQWTHCRNCINNSDKGDVGALGNEPANLLCSYTNYTVIGTIYLYGDKWVLFSTDDNISEIGIFDDSECTYTVIVNDATAFGCLNFKRSNLITGASKENFDCTWQVYWDDGLNPSRTLNLQNIPWRQVQITGPEIDGSDCITYQNIEPLSIDCEKIRLAPFMKTPNLILSKSDSGGQLRNGSYQAFLAYSVNGQQVGDWIGVSNVQALWDHNDMSGSLNINLVNVDKDFFEEFKIVILSNWQQEQQAKELGTYSVHTEQISVDYINQELTTVPLESLPLTKPAYEKSDKMYVVNDYLVRQGPTERFDFNYQPLANQIETFWTITKFPADYYAKGGNKPTFMRDEVYSFFIRWIYNTGEKSSSYHIPGRHHSEYDQNFAVPGMSVLNPTDAMDPNNLTVNAINVTQESYFQSWNTSILGPGFGAQCIDCAAPGPFNPFNNPNYFGAFRTNDGGVITHVGTMAYWQSTEKYPNDPVRWNANINDERYDLCNTPIRHHKFPDEQHPISHFNTDGIDSSGAQVQEQFLSRSTLNNQYINVLGVKFNNIHLPRLLTETVGPCDKEGEEDPQLVPGIIGYEILVGSRDGNKSIIAKGLARNMRGHRLPPDSAGNESGENFGNMRGVHANYPFNDLRCDPYLHDPGTAIPPRWPYGKNGNQNSHGGIGQLIPNNPLDPQQRWAYRDMFTFHSPDTSFNRPFLSPFELKSYGVTAGSSIGRFKESEKHPKQKLLRDIAAIISIIFGAGYAVAKTRGSKEVKYDYPQPYNAVPGVASTAAPTNAAALGIQQGGAAITESVHTMGTIAGAPSLAGQVALGGNTALGLLTTPMMWGGYQDGGYQVQYKKDQNWFSELPALLQPFYGIMAFLQLSAEGGNHIYELIYNLASFQDYAYKYNSHGLYWRTMLYLNNQPMRTKVRTARYVKNTIQNLTKDIKMNNLFRPNTVAIVTEDETDQNSRVLPTAQIDGTSGTWVDNSRATVQNCYYPTTAFTRHIAAHYCALKVNFDNQYGQLDTIKQIPINNGRFGGGTQYLYNQISDFEKGNLLQTADHRTVLTSDTLYGGDCYIARYTEKVTMPMFWDFLVGQPDGFPYDYRLRSNLMYPMYWANFHRYDLTHLTKYITSFQWLRMGLQQAGALPSGFHHLDQCNNNGNDNCIVAGFPPPWNDGIAQDTNADNTASGNVNLEDGTGADVGWTPNFPVFGVLGAGDGPDNDSTSSGGFNWSADTDGSGPQGSGAPVGSEPWQATGTDQDWVNDPSPDRRDSSMFVIKDRYFYTHVNGVNDFFVESPINVALRDHEDQRGKVHYDWQNYTDVNELFHADIQAQGNFYKYDFSLQIDKIVTHRISWADIQPSYYDPYVAETCWTHYPKRLQYSLQAQQEAVRDFWRVYLPNNYKDFKNKVNVIKPISKSGAIILFPHLAPVMWQGVDTLQTDLGTKLTIGDGGLFSQPQQNIVNADLAHEYGSCESSRSVINTPTGLYYMSQAQGKIFNFTGKGLVNIADAGMKQWFNEYLPSRLIKQFPELEHCTIWSDNPVVGVGCQSVYDPNYDLVYFMKRDFDCISECIDFIPCEGFFYNQTRCDNFPAEICCPDNMTYNYETGQCERSYYVDAVEPEEECPILVDIILALDHSISIEQNNNIGGMGDFAANLAIGFFDELAADEVRISCMSWDHNSSEGIDYAGPYSNSADVVNWAYDTSSTGFVNSDGGTDYGYGVGTWGSTIPPMGFWKALHRVYRDGRPGVPKVLILAMDGYSAEIVRCKQNDQITGVDCETCAQGQGDRQHQISEGWSSGFSFYATQMDDIISDNPGEPGSLDFYMGNNAWGIYGNADDGTSDGFIADIDIPTGSPSAFEWTGDDSQFPGPYQKPVFDMTIYNSGGGNGGWYDYIGTGPSPVLPFTGCARSDNFIDWLNANVFDAACRYQDPAHADFDGQLTVWGIWFTPWNGVEANPAYELSYGDFGAAYLADTDFWTTVVGGYTDQNGTEYDVPIYIGSNHPDNGDSATAGNIAYTEARSSSPQHALTGSLVSPSEIQGMVDSILDQTCIEYGTPYCPEDCPNSVLFQNEANQWMCECTEVAENEGEGESRIPVDLDNPLYFKDISWTASYDPKAKAWISFHDWHPELSMPSLRHFLTIKSEVLDEGVCPPGTVFNSTGCGGVGCCQAEFNYEYPAVITIDEQNPITNDNYDTGFNTQTVQNACPWDITFSIDRTGSLLSASGFGWDDYQAGLLGQAQADVLTDTIWYQQLVFINAFAEALSGALANNSVQISIITWGDMCGLGDTTPLTDDTRLVFTSDINAIKNFLGVDPGNDTVTGLPYSNANWANGIDGTSYTSASNQGFNDNLSGTGQTWLPNLGSFGGTSYRACVSALMYESSFILDAGWTDQTTGLPTQNVSVDANGNTIGTNSQGHRYLGRRDLFDPNYSRFGIMMTDSNDNGHARIFQRLTGDGWQGAQTFTNPNDGSVYNPNTFISGADYLNAMIWQVGTFGYYRILYDQFNLGVVTGCTINHYYRIHQDQLNQGLPGDPLFVNNTQASAPLLDMQTIVVKTRPDNTGIANYIDGIFVLDQTYRNNGEWDSDNTVSPAVTYAAADGISCYFVNTGTPNCPDCTTVANNILNNLNCNFTINVGWETDDPDTCICPDDSYTPVYLSGTQWYDSPEGNCNSGMVCRKVECYCPPNPLGAEWPPQISGECPDIYLVGNPEYVNDNPPMCIATGISEVLPSYERGSIWKHNVRCDLFANYYTADYPWEIEWVESVGQQVATVRSIEYQLESYVYSGNLDNNCGDRFHDLDWNFDESIIHNTEQVSGLLKLNLSPKNDVPLITDYPIVNAADIDILYSKEEQKYRFNQFWDTTYDRGEFNLNIQNSIFITQLNGYIRDLNVANLNYNKSALQRKKFRHYYNKVILRKTVSGDRKMILKLANAKINYSFR